MASANVLVPLALALAMVGWGIVERLSGHSPADQVYLAVLFGIWATWRAGR
jgi:hypothetical protein